MVAERLQLTIAPILGSQPPVSHRPLAEIVEDPHVGIARLVEDGLKRQGEAAAMSVVSPRIPAAGIGYQPSHRAFSSRHIPRAARQLLGNHLGNSLQGRTNFMPLPFMGEMEGGFQLLVG